MAICAVITREVGLTRVPGGSEDILLDLAIRELLKIWERDQHKADAKI